MSKKIKYINLPIYSVYLMLINRSQHITSFTLYQVVEVAKQE